MKNKKTSLGKKTLIGIEIMALIAVFVGIFWAISHYNNIRFSKHFMAAMGGEQLLKKECLDTHYGPHKMSDGTIHEKLLTPGDIERISVTCDCMVAKSYKMFIDMKPKIKSISIESMPPEIVDTFRQMLFVFYDTCETEMTIWLSKKYKTIEIN